MASLWTAMRVARGAHRLMGWRDTVLSVPIWQVVLIGTVTTGVALLAGRWLGL